METSDNPFQGFQCPADGGMRLWSPRKWGQRTDLLHLGKTAGRCLGEDKYEACAGHQGGGLAGRPGKSVSGSVPLEGQGDDGEDP